jgi:glycosyltransferase involved in cell wall biosynthesis
MPLKILQVVPAYFPAVRYGGPIRSVHYLAAALVERGHEVHVFTSTLDGPDDVQVPHGTPVLLDGVKVSYFPVPLLRRLCWCPSMWEALESAARGSDIMHLHSVFLWPTWAAARIAASAGLPYVMSPRGMLGKTVIRSKSRWVKSAWIRLFEERNLRNAGAVHVTSEVEAAELAALDLTVPRVECIPNGVSGPTGYETDDGGPCSGITRPYALFLSRIDWKKGLDRLIESWRWVPNLTLVIAGNDESGYRKKMEDLVELHRLHDRIVFVGPVSDTQKWPLYANAMMFVLPSYSENFGNVVAEAMIMGCPVVITPEVGLATLVSASGAGVVTDGDPAALAAAVRDLQHDELRRRVMGDRGRLAARRHLSWESVASRMEQLYMAQCSDRATKRRTAA